jgi:phenol 2-monooxygenase
MNTSLQDGYNIGWKMAQVIRGQASPELLKTYVLERQKVASDLIDFDRYFSTLFSRESENGSSPEHFNEQFFKAGRYTAGLTATYGDSLITSAGLSTRSLAKNVTVGMRFPSAQVVRFCDAKAM